MEVVQDYLEGSGARPRRASALVAENTRRRPIDDRSADVVRRGLFGRARLRRLDLAHRHLVAARPHVTGQPELRSCSSRASAGRIYERTPAGTEHDWGEVTVWEPPARLAYLWHLRPDRGRPPRSRSASSR